MFRGYLEMVLVLGLFDFLVVPYNGHGLPLRGLKREAVPMGSRTKNSLTSGS